MPVYREARLSPRLPGYATELDGCQLALQCEQAVPRSDTTLDKFTIIEILRLTAQNFDCKGLTPLSGRPACFAQELNSDTTTTHSADPIGVYFRRSRNTTVRSASV